MTDMVTRVARAISEKLEQEMAAQFGYFSPSIDEECEETGRIRIDGEFDPKELARAAIEAMRTLDPAMMESAAAQHVEDFRQRHETFTAQWNAAIDAALREPNEEEKRSAE